MKKEMSTRMNYYSLSDEKQNLHKQIGCMNGIFQIFDRRYILGVARNRNKLLSSSPVHNESNPIEPNSVSHKTSEKTQKKTSKEKQRVSTESSRTSFSSTASCSSSFSSLDTNNRAAHLETTLPSRVNSTLNTTQECRTNQHHAALSCHQSIEFRDIVKVNMNREACGISVRTVAGEAVSRKSKQVDSPRPVNSGSNESFRVLAKLREAHRKANEEIDIPAHSASKFNRRLSYDGRESNDTLKSTIKIKELPRLSLDSKESWAKRSAPGTRSNNLVKDLQKGNTDIEEPVSSRHSSTVIARLMGLEALPDSTSTTNSPSRLINVYQTYEQNSSSRSSKMNAANEQQSRFSRSPRMKPNASTTQKSHVNRKLDFNEPATESHKLTTNFTNSSVYGEIEKRLSMLEFAKSGKDLRALKQILEAMQKSRVILENSNEQASDFASQMSTASNSYKSSIIIMKPAKHSGKTSNSSPSVIFNGNEQVKKLQSVKDIGSQSIREKNANTRISKSTKSTKDRYFLNTETSTTSGSSPRITSSRLHKKFGLEKQSSPTITSSDSSRTEKINSKKVGSYSKQKSPTLNQNSTKRSSKIGLCPRDMNQQGCVYPLRYDSYGVASNMDMKNTSNNRADDTRSNFVLQDDDGCEQRNPEMRLSNSITEVKATLTSSEQQSPVSVLDSTFYQEDSPSPIKKISYAFQDDETINSEEELSVQSHKSTEILSIEIKNLKSEIDNLRKQIRRVNFNTEEEDENELVNDCQNHPCQDMNSQHKYIWQILSESGLLKELDHDLSAIQLHSPGHLINPNLFLALEKSKSETHNNKVQRKLVFDTVNEILFDKLALERSSNHWLPTSNRTESKGQQIMKQLYTQIDQLQDSNQNGSLNDYNDASKNMIRNDLMHPSPGYWGDYKHDVPGIVLDVERLIFKDLITEIVMNNAGF